MNGMTVMTAHVLDALKQQDLRHVHLDISDHREVGNVGRLDFQNVRLAFRHMAGMFAAIQRHRPRLVYLPIAQGTLGFLRDWLLFLVAQWHGIPVVVHLHGAAFDAFYRRSGAFMRWVIRSSLRPAQTAIVLGESLREIFGRLVPAERIAIVSNGIPDRPDFMSDEPHGGPVQVLFLSNLSVAKGYLDVIIAAANVVARHPHVRFTIAGEWPGRMDAATALDTLSSLGLHGKVRVVPAVTGLRKNRLFQQSDIFVFPPRQLEGQPVVLLEAMSHGMPVITTAQGGIVDTVVSEETGLFVPPQDPDALADAICSLIEDPARRAAMGRAGRAHYLRHFGEMLFQRSLAGVLREAIEAGSTPFTSALEER